ncbi:phage portal protein, partial [Streptococcus sobrinus]
REAIEYEDFETGKLKRIDHKVNNRLNNSFDSEVIDTKVGYLFGHPIAYEFDESGEASNAKLVKQLIEG